MLISSQECCLHSLHTTPYTVHYCDFEFLSASPLCMHSFLQHTSCICPKLWVTPIVVFPLWCFMTIIIIICFPSIGLKVVTTHGSFPKSEWYNVQDYLECSLNSYSTEVSALRVGRLGVYIYIRLEVEAQSYCAYIRVSIGGWSRLLRCPVNCAHSFLMGMQEG